MSKHDYVLTEEQKIKIQWLMDLSTSPGFEWTSKLATHLVDLYTNEDHYRRAYETEQGTSERAAIMLEEYAGEIQWLRADIDQVVKQMPDEGPVAMWKEAIRLLTMPRSQREKTPAEAVPKEESSCEKLTKNSG